MPDSRSVSEAGPAGAPPAGTIPAGLVSRPPLPADGDADDADAAFTTLLTLPPVPERRGEGGLRTRGLYRRGGHFDPAGPPLLTVVTVVLNGAATLPDTIAGIRAQAPGRVEWLVIDGGSTDGTLDLLRAAEDVLDYWVSEPDDGLYDAMNKGLRLATGSHVVFVSADDVLRPVSDAAWQALERTRDGGLVYGDVAFTGERVRRSRFGPALWLRNCLQHQGALVSLALYKRLGTFDTAYRVLADYDMALRQLAARPQAIRLAEVLADCRPGGLSGTRALCNYVEEMRIKMRRLPLPLALLAAPLSPARFAVLRLLRR